MPNQSSELNKRFEDYGWFSVQVDQYYNVVKIYARNHDLLKSIFNAIPDKEKFDKTDFESLDDDFRKLILASSNGLTYMSSTGIFKDVPFPELEDLPTDMINFGFYTCFCFQWTLFENFVREAINELVQKNSFPDDVVEKLKKVGYGTKRFLDYINSGEVFGQSPFVSILPVKGWEFTSEEIGYSDLDEIRNLRNKFIHAVQNKAIMNKSEIEKEKLYLRSMLILRQFAGNINQEMINLVKNGNEF